MMQLSRLVSVVFRATLTTTKVSFLRPIPVNMLTTTESECNGARRTSSTRTLREHFNSGCVSSDHVNSKLPVAAGLLLGTETAKSIEIDRAGPVDDSQRCWSKPLAIFNHFTAASLPTMKPVWCGL